MVALVNPKAILIFTAFLPQFVDASRPVAALLALAAIGRLLMRGESADTAPGRT